MILWSKTCYSCLDVEKLHEMNVLSQYMRERCGSYKLSSLWAMPITYHRTINSQMPWPWARRNQPMGLALTIRLAPHSYSFLQLATWIEQISLLSSQCTCNFDLLVCMWQVHISSGRVSQFLVLFHMTTEVWITLIITVVEMDKSCGNVIIVMDHGHETKEVLTKKNERRDE